MGVKGLQRYMEAVTPNGTLQVSVVELAIAHKQANNCVPILAVDGMSVLHRLYKMDNLEWLYGGQWKEYVESFRRFVRRFRDEGIEPIFFFDAVVESSKTREWIDRRVEKLKDVRKIFDHVLYYRTHPDEQLSQLPACMATLIRFALKYICNCEVVNSVVDADKEIARYALTTRGCFAILSQDSDYVIFNTKPYLSVNHLQLDTLETIEYNRYGFAQDIGLSLNQLPLLACLMGNDFVHLDSIRHFHRSITSSRGYVRTDLLVPKLAQYILKMGWLGNLRSEYSLVERIANHIGITKEKLYDGLWYYSILEELQECPPVQNLIDPMLLETVRQKHRNCTISNHIYALLTQLNYKSSECLEDERSTGLKPSTIIFRNLRRHLYALLFGNIDVQIEELSAIQGLPVLLEKVSPQPVQVFGIQPTLRDLWRNPKPEIGWKVLCATMGVQISENVLKEVPACFAGLAMLLNYVLRNPVGDLPLELWEINAIIAQAVSPMASNLQAIRNLQVHEVEARAIHLATMILRGLIVVINIVQTCGEPFPAICIMPWCFFDGKLFHHLYLRAKAGANLEDLLLNDEKAMEEFMQIRTMAISGTYLEIYEY